MANLNFVPDVVDYSIFGSSEKETIKETYGQEALINSLKVWVSSFQGDFIGARTRGGYLTEAISRPMTSVTVEEIHSAIMDGLLDDFRPRLEILSLTLTPDFQNRRWLFNLEAFSPELNIKIGYSDSFKGAE